MATPSDISVGLAHELTITATKAGWAPKDFAALAHSEHSAREVLAYLRGLSEIRPILRAIDCDAAPFTPESLSVEEHRKGGTLVWDPVKVTLYLSKTQRIHRSDNGNDLRQTLASMPVVNANVLDYLLKPENQHLIPESWWMQYVFFWGTIYRGFGENLCVRYACRHATGWTWSCHWLNCSVGDSSPALVLTSPV